MRVNGKDLFKPYEDSFLSDRVKRNTDLIRDVQVETFYRKDQLSAVLWYAKTNFFGTIIDDHFSTGNTVRLPYIEGLRRPRRVCIVLHRF